MVEGPVFEFGARTRGLKKASDLLDKVIKKSRRLATATDAASKKASKAYDFQARSIEKAVRATQRINDALRKSGANSAQIGANTRALNKLAKEFSRGQISAEQYTRSIARFNAQLTRSRRALRTTSTASKKTTTSLGKLNKLIRNLESASVLAVGPLSGIGARIRSLGSIASRSNLAVVGLFAAITAGLVTLGVLSAAAVKSAFAFERLQANLIAATGSTIAANVEFRNVRTLAERFGLAIESAATSFSQFAAATTASGFTLTETRSLFEGVTVAGAALRLSNEQITGTFRALQQIASKGIVQAEEIRGQFAERVPGGFAIAAKAIGLTVVEFDKLLRRGEITARRLLPALARELKGRFAQGAAIAADSLAATTGRLSTAFFEFSRQVDDTFNISEGFKTLLKGTTAVLKGVTEGVEDLGNAWGTTRISQKLFIEQIKEFVASQNELIQTDKKATNETIANTQKRLAAQRAELKALKAAALAATSLVLDFRPSEVEGQLKKIQDAIEETEAAIKSLQDITGQGFRPFVETGKDFDRVKKSVEGLFDEVAKFQRLSQVVSRRGTKGGLIGEIVRQEDIETARELIKILSPKEAGEILLQLRERFQQLGINTQSVSDALTALAKRAREGADAVADLKDKAAATGPALLGIAESFSIMRQRITAFAEGKEAVDELKKTLARNEALVKFKKILDSTTLDPLSEQAKALTKEYLELFDAVVSGEEEFKANQKLLDAAAKAAKKLEDADKKLAEQLTRDLVPAIETYNMRLEVLQRLLDKTLISETTFARAVEVARQQLEASQAPLQKAIEQIEELRLKTEALGKGQEALDSLEKSLEINKAVESFRALLQPLVDLEISQERLNDLVRQFRENIIAFDEAEKKAKRLKAISEEIEKAFERGFDRIGSAITEAFVTGEGAAIKFGNVVKGVISEILQALIKATIISPLTSALTGFVQGLATAFVGGGLTGSIPTGGGSDVLAGTTFTAKGAAFMGGRRLTALARGGVLSGPTIIPLQRGAAIGGEAGTEAVLPLKRLPGGDLGVQSEGGGGTEVNVTIINNTDAEIKTESKKSQSGEDIIVTIDRALSRMASSGNSQLTRTLQELFGAGIRPVGRGGR